jgi:hypothetical protein
VRPGDRFDHAPQRRHFGAWPRPRRPRCVRSSPRRPARRSS